LVEGDIVTQIHYSTVCLILQEADLQPHRQLYWKRSFDPNFEAKAKRILWYYERADQLRRRGELVFCLDEKPGIQLLGRPHPDLPAEPGCPLRREHEYIRRGTGLLLMINNVTEGSFTGFTPPSKASANLIRAIDAHARAHRRARKLHYILDNDSTHRSAEVVAWMKTRGDRIRLHYTPTGSSWLNQAEIALSVFSRRYLNGRVWESAEDFPGHVRQSVRHYNASFAHRFDWSFTRDRFREWIRSKTLSTRH
jgi:transposase